MKYEPSQEYKNNVARFKKIAAINPVEIVDNDMEIHEAGTRDKLAWYDDALHAAYQQADGLREQVATLETELHDQKNETQTAIAREVKARIEYNEAMTLVGKLYALLLAGAAEDSREVALANALIGIVPDGDVSTPWGGLDAIPFTEEEGA